MCQEQTLDWPHPGFLIPSVKSAVSDRGQTLHLKTPDGAMAYLFRYLLKNAVMLSWICPYISRHLLSLNPLLACCRRYSRGER